MPDDSTAELAPDPRLLASEDLARTALLEITDESTVGPLVGHAVEGDGVLSLFFEARMSGYPGWHWTVTVALVDDAEPTVLEAELMPGDDALIAPEWVPWSDRARRAADDDSDDGDDDADDDDDDDDSDEDDDSDDDDADDDDDDDDDADDDDVDLDRDILDDDLIDNDELNDDISDDDQLDEHTAADDLDDDPRDPLRSTTE